MWVEWWSHTPVLQQQLQQQPEVGQHVYIPDRHQPVLAQCLPETQAERLVIIHVPVMMVNGDLQTREFVLSWERNSNYYYCLCCPGQQQLHCCCFHHHHYCCFPIPSHSQPPRAGHGYYGLLAAGSSPCGLERKKRGGREGEVIIKDLCVPVCVCQCVSVCAQV